MAARHLVAAVGADDEHRLALQCGREHREHVERALVGAVQIVEKHCRGGRVRERRDDPVAQRGPVEARDGAELRHSGGQRPVRRGAPLHPGALAERELRAPKHVAGEHGLPGAGFAGQQHQRAPPGARLRERLAQLRALRIAADEHVSS